MSVSPSPFLVPFKQQTQTWLPLSQMPLAQPAPITQLCYSAQSTLMPQSTPPQSTSVSWFSWAPFEQTSAVVKAPQIGMVAPQRPNSQSESSAQARPNGHRC
jgi:hypothetical protein